MQKEKMFTVKSKHNGGIYVIGEVKLKSEFDQWEMIDTEEVDTKVEDLKVEEDVKRAPASKTYVKYSPRKTKK